MHGSPRALVKEALLLLYLVADGGNVVERVASLGASMSLGVYLGFYLLLAGALWVASRLANVAF